MIGTTDAAVVRRDFAQSDECTRCDICKVEIDPSLNVPQDGHWRTDQGQRTTSGTVVALGGCDECAMILCINCHKYIIDDAAFEVGEN